MKKDKIPGGKAKGKSLKDIAMMHSTDKSDSRKIDKLLDSLKIELKKGIKTELEHTTNEEYAKEIAMDHLYEDPKYYTKLSKIEEMKNTKKLNLNDLSRMVKKALNEEFEGGVNYDTDVAIELKSKVGQLSKLTPYVLELGNRVVSDITGKVSVYEDTTLKKKFNNVDDLLKGIKYGPTRITEEDSSMPHKDHEAMMAKAEIRDMVKNAKEVYKMIQPGDELPGWVSAYITLASDYMHSIAEYMTEKNSSGEDLEQ